MGIRRYSRDSDVKRWQERFDALQMECHSAYLSATIGELRAHGIEQGQWRCRNIGWKDDGRGECWHTSKPFPLARYPSHVRVFDIRQCNTCGQCGRKRPFLELLPSD